MDKEKFIKENILYILLVVFVIIVGLFLTAKTATQGFDSLAEFTHKKSDLSQKQKQLAELERKRELANMPKPQKVKSGKIIYEVLDKQFSAEASFGIMFENILSNITNSGIRIRSIDYNYNPSEDKILLSNLPGYNACELSIVAVGNYSQLQTFFKNIVKENYLSNIHEIYIEPYDKDKTILIAKFKIRLYTKTV